ncbi:MAG: ISLre2 family transposase [Lachnospiraceae bacterium]
MNIPVELRIGKEEFADFADLENSLFEALMAAGRELFRTMLSALDEKLLETRDQEAYRNKGLRKTCVKTRLGEVEYDRHVYEQRRADGSKQYVYLLDEALGKQTVGTVSMTVCQMAAEAVTESTYRSSSRQIAEMTGLTLSHQGVWNIVQKLGEAREEEIEQQRVRAKAGQGRGELVSKILYEEADGIWLKLQGADRKEKGAKAEMKLAIAYDGALWSTGKKRRTLDNKVAYAGFEPAKEFMARKEGVIADHYDVDEIELRVVNGDGAAWIKSGRDADGIYVLDEFHRNKAITEYVDDEDLRQTMRQLLYEGKIDDLLLCIEASIESTLDEQEQEKRRSLLAYFTNNKEGLLDYYHRGITIPETRHKDIHHARLGSMESNIFTIIGNRMKGRRACWSLRGAGNLARLLCLKHTTGYGHLFSRTETGRERKTLEEYRAPLSAGRIRETVGRGYESPLRAGTLCQAWWLKQILAPTPLADLKLT